MNTVLVVVTTIAATLGTATAARAQTAIASDESPFRFKLEQTASPRGLAVKGYLYNALAWRITNVRLRIDSVDADGSLVASASGWVVGDVAAGGCGFFYIPVSAPAATYRATVQTYKVMLEMPAPQTPCEDR
jgi:hypothetical protein